MDGDGHDTVGCGGDDCDDTDADRFPGNPESCDDGASGQHDEDCDPETFGTTDRDGDGEVSSSCCNMGTSGLNCGSDCDDTTIRRRSGQVEFCDSVDNDCDGRTDEEAQAVPWYPDGDGDGFGSSTTPMISCVPVPGHSLASTDCDDTSAQEHPAQLDICDLTDNNCNTEVDELPVCGVVLLLGNAGGTLTTTALGGGTISVQVPAGALNAPSPLAIGEIHPRALPRLAVDQSFVGRPLAISPYEQGFMVPANVVLPATGQNLAVLRLDNEDDTTWEVVTATFIGGEARFGIVTSGIYAVVTKNCTASTETCDGLDNDCDWLVDEDDVCAGPQTLADRLRGWWVYCFEDEGALPSPSSTAFRCNAQPDSYFEWFTLTGTSGSFQGECALDGPWSTPTESTLSVTTCEGRRNEASETSTIAFQVGDRYMIRVSSTNSYDVFERVISPPGSCDFPPYTIDSDCGSLIEDLCNVNEYVSGGACVPCPTGTVNMAGGDPVGGDTQCHALCDVDEHVQSGVCVGCPIETTNAAGDDPWTGNTLCDTVPCLENEHVIQGFCYPCSFGGINTAGDDPSGVDTDCDGVCSDAGAPVLYRFDALNVPTSAQANSGTIVGHNVDFSGTSCSVPDWSGGVDNSLIDFFEVLPNIDPADPLLLQSEIDDAIACPMSGASCERLDLILSVRAGTGCAIVEILNGGGSTLMTSTTGTMNSGGQFSARSSSFDISIPVRMNAASVYYNIHISNVFISGMHDGVALTSVIIGGVIERDAFETSVMGLVPVLGGVTFEQINPILSNLYDVQVAGTCSGLSAGFLGSGSALP